MIPRLRLNRMVAFFSFLAAAFLVANAGRAADAPDEWKKVLAAAKKEGKVVVGGPPTSVLRQKFKDTFEKRFGIDLELLSAPGPQNASRAMSEFKAGVKYFDVLHGGSGTLEPLMRENMLAPFMDFVILAEVKDPRQWWGGHMWEDNIKTHRFIYSYSADFPTPPFFNADLIKPDEVKSYDDFLHPKWKSKIGFFEPRVPSAGQGLWGFLMKIKGREFLQKLVHQELFISRDGKQLADSLAKGTLAFNLGQSQRFIEPYLKAGIPIKPLNKIKEGLSGSNGFGTVAVLKNA
ncbi:MAG TPA: extracellular solute-binding protein, partial [Candidatus Binatia bacterium]